MKESIKKSEINSGFNMNVSPALLNSVLESISDPLYMLDAEFCYIGFNEAHFADMKSLHKTEIELGKNILDYLKTTEDKERVSGNLEKVLNGENVLTTSSSVNSDLKQRYFEISYNPIFTPSGIIIGITVIYRDITERKKAEMALQASEERFKSLFYKAPLSYQSLDINGNLIEVNQQWLDTFGYTYDEVIGKRLSEFVSPDYRNFLQEQFNLFKKQGSIYYEIEFVHQKGYKIDVAVQGKITNDINGNFKQTHCILDDITERKLTEEKLIKTKNLFSQAFNSSPSPMTIARQADGVYIEVNESFLRLVECSRDEVIGKTGATLNLIDSDSRETIINHLRENGNLHNIEVTAKSRSGKNLILLTSIEDTEIDGQACTLATMLDITEKRLAEEKLRNKELKHRAILQTAMDGYWMVDKKGKILEVNESLCKMSGYSNQELLQMHVSDVEDVEKQVDVEQHIKKVIELGGHRFETRHKRKDGSVYDLEVSIQEQEAGGNIVAFFRDITNRKQAENALLFERSKLAAAFENPSMGFVISNAQGDEISMNATALRFHDFDSLEHMHRSVREYENEWELYSTDGKLLTYDEWPLVKACRGEFQQNVEYHYHNTRTNRSWICNYSSVPVHNSAGEVSLIVQTLLDITERKLAEKSLRESEVQYKNLANSGLSLMWTSGTDKLCNYFNKTWLDFTGRTLEQEVGNGWAEGVYPDDFDHCLETYITAFDKREPFEMEYRLRHASGEYRWILDMGTPNYNSNGEFIGYIGNCFDISQRKKVDEALKESEERFRNFFENSVVGKSITTMDGKLKVNNAFSKIVGYTEAELNQLSWQEITYKDDIDSKQYEIDLILKGDKKSCQFQSRYIHKNGNVVWVDINSSLQRDNSGNPLYFITVINDITDRKIIEENLRQSEDRYRSLFERNYSVMLILNPETGDIIDANPAACEYYGWSYGEICHKNIAEINTLSANEIKTILANTKVEKKAHLFLNHRLANGDVRDVEIYTTPIYYGSSIMLYSIVHDITEKKQAENKLRESEQKFIALFSSMTEMVAIHELVFNNAGEAINYRIIDCNIVFSEITGIKKEDAIGKLATDVYQTENPPYFEQYVQVALTGKSFEFDSFFAPMNKHFVISVVSPKKNIFATITTDITAIKQVQDEITAKNKELENYLYIASHDLRSPLVNIQGFSQRLQKQSNLIKAIISESNVDEQTMLEVNQITNEAIPKTLNFILSNVVKMDSLINSLLQISRTGRLILSVKNVNMNKLFNTIISAHNFLLTEHNALVKLNDLPDCYGDENQLNQVFSNIVDNAIKYRDENRQLVIEISSIIIHNKVIYCISDSGKGINSKYQEKIWDIFYRIDPASTQTGEGIGLSIAKTITTKHKGRIWVESDEGKGSTFYVELHKTNFSE